MPRSATFDVPPGRMQLRMTVEAPRAGHGFLDDASHGPGLHAPAGRARHAARVSCAGRRATSRPSRPTRRRYRPPTVSSAAPSACSSASMRTRPASDAAARHRAAAEPRRRSRWPICPFRLGCRRRRSIELDVCSLAGGGRVPARAQRQGRSRSAQELVAFRRQKSAISCQSQRRSAGS